MRSPPRKPAFAAAARAAIETLAAETGDGGPGVMVGTIWAEDGKLYNSIAMLDGGRIEAVRHKVDLPNYGVFDEKRVFDQGPMPGPVSFRGVRIGVPICEDIWKEEVCECLQETGSEMLISPNGSPFDWPKPDQRIFRRQTAPAAVLAHPFGGDDGLAEGRQLERERTVGVQAERSAVEHELVLSAHHVEIDQRQAALDHARDRDVEPRRGLVAPIR